MLSLSFSLTEVVANINQLTLADTTPDWGVVGNPARDTTALIIGTELLSPWQAQSTEKLQPQITPYDPLTLQALDGGPILLTRPQDGVLRVFVAAIPIVAASQVLALLANTAYALATGEVLVRGTGPVADDVVLTNDMLLGQGAGPLPNVITYTVGYHLWNQGLLEAMARLNLHYLQLPYYQQQPKQQLYERVALYADGADRLYKDKRYLDCVAVLEGANRLLVTDGQTPDDFVPLLTGVI